MILSALPPQDAFYGIAVENITVVLDTTNWTSKSIVRVDRVEPNLWVYIWLREVTAGEVPAYLVRCAGPHPDATQMGARFQSLADALDCANGEVADSLLVRTTRASRRSEWPCDEPPASMLASHPR